MRAAALTGAVAALSADADIVFGNVDDPIVAQELHRHFTHALIFVPVGAALIALLLYRWMRSVLSPLQLYVAAFAGLATAGLLDACTGYGTHLLWPFTDERTALNLVSIIDPLFTLLVATPLTIGLWRNRPAFPLVALLLGGGWLALAAFQQQRVLETATDSFAAQGVTPERILVRPSFGNIVLWRVLSLAEGQWRADAVHAGWLSHRIYPGESAPAWQLEDPLPEGLSAETATRFARLSDDALIADEAHGRLGDARFAMLPDSMQPMWGITVDPDGRTRWFTDRSLTPTQRSRFIAMLRGADLP